MITKGNDTHQVGSHTIEFSYLTIKTEFNLG